MARKLQKMYTNKEKVISFFLIYFITTQSYIHSLIIEYYFLLIIILIIKGLSCNLSTVLNDVFLLKGDVDSVKGKLYGIFW